MKRERLRQLEFMVFHWGGKRRGAGRKPKGARAGVSHARRPTLKACNPLHITLRVAADVPKLRDGRTHELLRRVIEATHRRHRGFQVVEYSLQQNHVHLIVEVESKEALSSAMNGFVSSLAKGINKLHGRRGEVFPDRYHARVADTPTEVRNLLLYVLKNRWKHGVWVHASPDPFSSGPQFDGWKDWKGAQSRWLPRARTWLLSTGWRKLGLLSVRERPKLQTSRR